MGNIFSDESGDLLVLDSREIMPDCVKKTVACMLKQFKNFMEERLISTTIPLSNTVKNNNFPTFSKQHKATPNQTDEGLVINETKLCIFSSFVYLMSSTSG